MMKTAKREWSPCWLCKLAALLRCYLSTSSYTVYRGYAQKRINCITPWTTICSVVIPWTNIHKSLLRPQWQRTSKSLNFALTWLACLTFKHSWAWTQYEQKKILAECSIVKGRYVNNEMLFFRVKLWQHTCAHHHHSRTSVMSYHSTYGCTKRLSGLPVICPAKWHKHTQCLRIHFSNHYYCHRTGHVNAELLVSCHHMKCTPIWWQ